MSDVRPPAVAGQFYPGERDSLINQIEECFTSEYGPGEIPEVEEGPHTIKGLVSPHAGYPYSGPVAAHGFSRLAKDRKPKSVVILGPNHSGLGPGISISSADAWKTPLGEISIDKELREEISEMTQVGTLDSSAHSREHSVEVQLPFLQHLFGSDFEIVPICMKLQKIGASEELGRTIGKTLEEKEAIVIASTDLTHYEPQNIVEEKDKKAIEKMEDLDWKGLTETVTEENISVCGYGPVSATILAAKNLGAKKGELFKHATSGDTGGPSAQVVGYCSLGLMGE